MLFRSATGAKGDPGTGSAAVAAHVRNDGPVTTAAQWTAVTWPLTGRTWTQGATSTDLLYGVATVQVPNSCDDRFPGYPGYAFVWVGVDGPPSVFLGSGTLEFSPGFAGQTRLVPLSFDASGGALFAPATDTPHVMEATVYDTCGGADQDFTFKSLKVDVISVS